jgi:small basic protein (TIGR04137 family)
MVYAPSAFFGSGWGLINGPTILTILDIMSQHRSLRAAATLGGKRNVLKRFERTELLKKRGQWKDGDRITGLRKTKPEA